MELLVNTRNRRPCACRAAMKSVAPGSASSSCTRTPSMSVSHDSTGLASVMGVILPYCLLRSRALASGAINTARLRPMTDARLPDPALVVLAGAAGSGKSTWAAERFRAAEVVSSDALRAAVGSGPSDLDASVEAFVILDQIIAARAKRSLMTVIDTLGGDPVRRTQYLHLARAAGLPAVLVIMNTAAALCRERNRLRDRPVPAPVLTEQLRRIIRLMESANEEGWDQVLIIDQDLVASAPSDEVVTDHDHAPETWPRVILQVSRFPWGEVDPRAWLCDMALRADEMGFHGLALMDHLIQIPQVDRAWEPIPEPWVTLGMIAGLDTTLQLGTLVSPVTF